MSAKGSPRLRGLRAAEQVAAVCYRVGKNGIDFLLVQTGGGRWTFPKGNAEPGLTHAQSAALEAFEEAGVHGRMEEAGFARYASFKRDGAAPTVVYAHLCEVTRLEPPQESKRNPTWFSAGKAKRRLLEGRRVDGGAELARVVDCALARFQRMRDKTALPAPPAQRDPLQEVPFEAGETLRDVGRLPQGSVREVRRAGDLRKPVLHAVDSYLCDVLRLGTAQEDAAQTDSTWATASRARSLGPAKKNPPKQLPN